MEDLKIGDGIEVTVTHALAREGMTGTIVCTRSCTYGVEFNSPMDGHSCEGRARDKCGWHVDKDKVRLVGVDNLQVGDRVELTTDHDDARKGWRGKIVNGDHQIHSVEFNFAFPGGGDCQGKAKSGHGHFIPRTKLKITSRGELNPKTKQRKEENIMSEVSVHEMLEETFSESKDLNVVAKHIGPHIVVENPMHQVLIETNPEAILKKAKALETKDKAEKKSK